MNGARLVAPLLLLALVGSAASGAQRAAAGGPKSEDLRYHWKLEGLSGVLAKLLTRLPTAGDAAIRLERRSEDRLEVEFLATSDRATESDYFSYATVVDPGQWRSLRVTETLRFKEKHRTKTVDLSEYEVIDVLSGLQQLRYLASKRAGRHLIWSDGKVYPVEVSIGPLERRQVGGGEVMARHLAVRGLREPKRHLWKASAELWLTDDAAAVPVEIIFHQALGRLRMTLADASAVGREPTGQ